MSWSHCSSVPLRPSRFYEDCESASEDFLYRASPANRKGEKGRIFTGRQRKETVFTGIRRSFLCCFGDRHGNGIYLPLSELGLDVYRAFGSARSQMSSAQNGDDSTFVRDPSKVKWVIKPKTSNKKDNISLCSARWIVLSWISRVINGETINRNMLDAIIVDALRGKNGIETISNSVIKGFPGLQLVENISSFETMDHVMAIDAIVEALSDNALLNRIMLTILVKKEGSCYAIYFNTRGDTKDVVLLEVSVIEKQESVQVIGFCRLENMREYMMDLSTLKSFSSTYYYMFNVKSPHHDVSGYTRKPTQNVPVLKTTIPEKRIELESYGRYNIMRATKLNWLYTDISLDPRRDAKLVFSRAKLVAKM